MSEMINLGICAGVKSGEKLYFSAVEFNGFFEYDFFTDKTTFICSFNGEDIHTKTHLKAFEYNDQIWFVPYQGEYISCFDIKSHKMIMEHRVWNYSEGKYAFIDAVKYQEKIFLVPRDSDSFVEIDMNTHEIRSLCSIEEDNKGRFRSVVILGDDKIGILATNGSIVKSINLKDGTIELLEEIQEGNNRYLTSVQDGCLIWLIPFATDEACCVDLNNSSRIVFKTGNKRYYRGVVSKEYVIMFSFDNESEILCINKKDSSLFSKIICVDDDQNIIAKGISVVESMDGDVWLATDNGYLLRLEQKYCEINQTRKMSCNKSMICEIIMNETKMHDDVKKFLENNLIDERHSNIDLDMFIKMINIKN